MARRLVELGVHVVAVGQTESKLLDLKNELGSSGKSLEIVQANLANWSETEEKLAEHCKTVDFLVNNAGYAHTCRVEDQSEEELDRTLNINLKAPMNLIRMVATGMKERKFGAIVNVSSVAAMAGFDEHAAYAASKAALDMVTRVSAKELGPFNVRVNSVNPTVVWTKLAEKHWGDPEKKSTMISKIPMGRFVEINEVVEPILHLLGDGSAMINGIVLPIDGGFSAT